MTVPNASIVFDFVLQTNLANFDISYRKERSNPSKNPEKGKRNFIPIIWLITSYSEHSREKANFKKKRKLLPVCTGIPPLIFNKQATTIKHKLLTRIHRPIMLAGSPNLYASKYWGSHLRWKLAIERWIDHWPKSIQGFNSPTLGGEKHNAINLFHSPECFCHGCQTSKTEFLSSGAWTYFLIVFSRMVPWN